MTFVRNWKRVALVVGLATGLICTGWEQPAGATSKTSGTIVPSHAVQPPSASQEKPSISRTSKRPISKGAGRPSLQKGHKKGQSPDHVSRNRERGKVTKKGPQAGGVDKVSQSLAFHGMLEQPERYDPSRDLRMRRGAALNPEARNLQIEHFQELDRNQDGVLDPLERAVGRLDIERDMNRH